MTWLEWTAVILAALLGSGGGLAAIIKYRSDRMTRLDQEEDAAAAAQKAADEKEDAKINAEAEARRNDAAAQVEELRAETAEQFDQINAQIHDMKQEQARLAEKIEGNTQGNLAQLFNSINHLGTKYVGKGPYIDAVDLRGLIELWSGYLAQIGDPSKLTDGPLSSYKYLCKVMEEVNDLKLRQ